MIKCMATDNKGVMVYLPPDLEEVLEKYCTENNITRKNRDGEPVPSMGTGIVQYLKSNLLGIALSNTPSTGLTKDEVLELIRESGTSNTSSDGLNIDQVTEIARGEVELGLSPISNDLVSLQSQLAEVKSDCDLTTEGIQRLIADAISKASISTTTTKKSHSPTTRTESTSTSSPQPNPETMKMVKRLQGNPNLRAAAEKGLAEGLVGKALCDWLFKQGYGANENANAFNPSVASNFRLAIEHLNSLENGG